MRSSDTYIRTFTGRKFWPLDPHPEDVFIEDIAHALSNNCRWGGHCRTFYSVAQHSSFVSDLLPPVLRLVGLMHDASEAFLLDLPRPVKRQIHAYEEAEHRLMLVIAERFGFTWPADPLVKTADNVALACERSELFRCDVSEEVKSEGTAKLRDELLCQRIKPLPPQLAEEMFLDRFSRVYGKLHAEPAWQSVV